MTATTHLKDSVTQRQRQRENVGTLLGQAKLRNMFDPRSENGVSTDYLATRQEISTLFFGQQNSTLAPFKLAKTVLPSLVFAKIFLRKMFVGVVIDYADTVFT